MEILGVGIGIGCFVLVVEMCGWFKRIKMRWFPPLPIYTSGQISFVRFDKNGCLVSENRKEFE